MIENFSYIRTGSLLARPEPPSALIPIPIPVFRPAAPIEDHGPAPVEVAILQELAEIKREVRALRAQSATQNASAVTLERASAMLGCKRSQVFKLLGQGQLTRAPKVGRSVMITVASIESLLTNGMAREGVRRCYRGEHHPRPRTKGRQVETSHENACAPQMDVAALIRKIDTHHP